MTAGFPKKRLKLVPQTKEEVRATIEALSAADKAHVSPAFLARFNSSEVLDHWTLGYILVHVADGTTIGQCAFKGPPNAEGVVEIAYAVDEAHRGQGYATEAALALVVVALNDDRVRLVCAHTMNASSASTRVLSKSGFRCVGQVVDSEDGLVWRWERKRGDDRLGGIT